MHLNVSRPIFQCTRFTHCPLLHPPRLPAHPYRAAWRAAWTPPPTWTSSPTSPRSHATWWPPASSLPASHLTPAAAPSRTRARWVLVLVLPKLWLWGCAAVWSWQVPPAYAALLAAVFSCVRACTTSVGFYQPATLLPQLFSPLACRRWTAWRPHCVKWSWLPWPRCKGAALCKPCRPAVWQHAATLHAAFAHASWLCCATASTPVHSDNCCYAVLVCRCGRTRTTWPPLSRASARRSS